MCLASPHSALNRVKTNNSTSKQHRKLKFGVQYYFNPNKEMKKKWVPSHQTSLKYFCFCQPDTEA